MLFFVVINAIGISAATQKQRQTNFISKVTKSSDLPNVKVLDFNNYKNIIKKKLAFFKFMLPFVEKMNALLNLFKYTLYKSQILYLGLFGFTRQFVYQFIRDFDLENIALMGFRCHGLSYIYL